MTRNRESHKAIMIRWNRMNADYYIASLISRHYHYTDNESDAERISQLCLESHTM